MKDLGVLSYFLGLEVTSSDDGYLLSQVKYASDLVSKAELNDGKSVSTPLEPNVKLTPMDGSPLFDPTRYRQSVGSLIYLTMTRLDIAYVLHIVSQFMAGPRSTHYAAILHIIRHVKGTLFHGLHFCTNSFPVLCAYSDTDWAGNPSDRRSTTGYYLFLGNSLISWQSKKQTIPSWSSTEAKTVILRRRRKPKIHRKPKPAGNQFIESTETQGEVITDPNSSATATPAPDEHDKDEEREEAIKCLSCFSFCIPTGSGFWIFQAPKGGQVIESPQIPEEDQIPSDRTKCWLFGIFTSVKRETPVEQGADLEAGPVETIDSNDIAGNAVVTYASASEPRGLEILKSIVYGGLIESITSLGVVSSAAGGGASTLNILALGLANLISGLIILIHSLSDLKNDRSGAEGVIGEISTQEDRYQELLGRRENFCLHTTVSILSYLIFGLVPPVVYGFSFRQSNDTDLKLAAVAAASFVCIILLAIGKAYVGKAPRSYFRTVLFYVIAGFSASGVSFLVGELVRKLLEKLGWFESSSDLIMPLLEAKTFEGEWASF
ncbi:hypothetical protein SLEP1_g34876 [Rubroshorea leprosula]|uniref:Membrane protein of ER body-like protein n=1 Tax=Rubroshorea leprosula TaxID=152421 RepID=A0AAV5KLE9_9ROSI|nr:hypothetical protein SLEP1_g34876 [Rubroshorea leprosula]